MLGQWVVCPIDPATQCIILKIVGIHIQCTYLKVLTFLSAKQSKNYKPTYKSWFVGWFFTLAERIFFWQRDSSYFLLSDAFAEGENRTHKTIQGFLDFTRFENPKKILKYLNNLWFLRPVFLFLNNLSPCSLIIFK